MLEMDGRRMRGRWKKDDSKLDCPTQEREEQVLSNPQTGKACS